MSTRQVKFSFDTQEEKAECTRYAKVKGLSLSAFARFATYQYMSKYPSAPKVAGRVQPYRPGADSDGDPA